MFSQTHQIDAGRYRDLLCICFVCLIWEVSTVFLQFMENFLIVGPCELNLTNSEHNLHDCLMSHDLPVKVNGPSKEDLTRFFLPYSFGVVLLALHCRSYPPFLLYLPHLFSLLLVLPQCFAFSLRQINKWCFSQNRGHSINAECNFQPWFVKHGSWRLYDLLCLSWCLWFLYCPLPSLTMCRNYFERSMLCSLGHYGNLEVFAKIYCWAWTPQVVVRLK